MYPTVELSPNIAPSALPTLGGVAAYPGMAPARGVSKGWPSAMRSVIRRPRYWPVHRTGTAAQRRRTERRPDCLSYRARCGPGGRCRFQQIEIFRRLRHARLAEDPGDGDVIGAEISEPGLGCLPHVVVALGRDARAAFGHEAVFIGEGGDRVVGGDARLLARIDGVGIGQRLHGVEDRRLHSGAGART